MVLDLGQVYDAEKIRAIRTVILINVCGNPGMDNFVNAFRAYYG